MGKKLPEEVRKFILRMAKSGGRATFKKYGRKYFSELGKKSGKARGKKLSTPIPSSHN